MTLSTDLKKASFETVTYDDFKPLPERIKTQKVISLSALKKICDKNLEHTAFAARLFNAISEVENEDKHD